MCSKRSFRIRPKIYPHMQQALVCESFVCENWIFRMPHKLRARTATAGAGGRSRLLIKLCLGSAKKTFFWAILKLLAIFFRFLSTFLHLRVAFANGAAYFEPVAAIISLCVRPGQSKLQIPESDPLPVGCFLKLSTRKLFQQRRLPACLHHSHLLLAIFSPLFPDKEALTTTFHCYYHNCIKRSVLGGNCTGTGAGTRICGATCWRQFLGQDTTKLLVWIGPGTGIRICIWLCFSFN